MILLAWSCRHDPDNGSGSAAAKVLDSLPLATILMHQALASPAFRPAHASRPCTLDRTLRRLDAQLTWRQYFNYLHRQLYVLDTYATNHNRRVNHSMMLLHAWASSAAVLPTLLGMRPG